jgi:hypothetical protein
MGVGNGFIDLGKAINGRPVLIHGRYEDTNYSYYADWCG